MRTVVDAPERLLAADYEWLPYRFHHLDEDRVAITNLAGEFVIVSRDEFQALAAHDDLHAVLARRLRGKHVVRLPGETLPLELLALKLRTRLADLSELTRLHIFVVTLRCEHSCGYCQVSRRTTAKAGYDMTEQAALRALDLVFQSPARSIKIEFQGGEPLLNFELVRFIVAEAERRNEIEGRNLAFVITSNLALLDDEVLGFCADHHIHLSTSLDGPPDLHNTNRPRPGGDSFERAIAGIRRAHELLGAGSVSALMTNTPRSLGRVREIVDTYLELGLHEVFFRPISPYGHAVRNRSLRYEVATWLEHYVDGLDYVLELNARGVPMLERYAAIVMRKMLSNEDPGYVDLMSPAGIGIGALVYNYDGDVYASDEGRMLAEMNDKTFRLGNVFTHDLRDLLLSDELLGPIEESFALSAPQCSDCAFEPYCGSDPVFHHATQADAVGHKPTSAFCQRNMGVFEHLLKRYHDDPAAREVFHRWAAR